MGFTKLVKNKKDFKNFINNLKTGQRISQKHSKQYQTFRHEV